MPSLFVVKFPEPQFKHFLLVAMRSPMKFKTVLSDEQGYYLNPECLYTRTGEPVPRIPLYRIPGPHEQFTDSPDIPTTSAGLVENQLEWYVLGHSRPGVWRSINNYVSPLASRLSYARRSLCTFLYTLPSHIRWLFQRESYWPLAQCQDCFLFRPRPRKLFLSRNGMLRCNEDRQLVMSLHPWASDAEAHLMEIAWYLGAEWALNNPSVDSQGNVSETFRVF